MILDIETYFDESALPLLPPVEAAGNLKDPQKILASILERSEKQLATMALEPDFGRIVAIGTNNGVSICPDEAAEMSALTHFWEQWRDRGGKNVIGYNLVAFDLPFILTRSWILGVECPALEIRKYGMAGVTDLLLMLSHNGMHAFRKLDFWCRRLKLDVPDDAFAGKDIAALVGQNAWADIRSHCLADVAKTTALANHLNIRELW